MHEVDQAMEAGFGYYEKVRSGRKRPSPERLMDLMRVLGFTPHHARVCYLELFRAEPILPAEPPSAHWETVIAGQREMACVVTPDGRLRAWNEPFAELFANAGVPANWWSWALSGHQAGEILLEWDTQWVPPLMEELRLLHLRHPDESALRDLYARARADRHLLRVAEARSGLNDLARPMRHPKRGPGTARIMAARTGAETIMTVLFEAA
ncbi:sulfotransferase [Streptomyces sp. NPDC006335]|uniref:sulfotransferase n=1 Tax=Streptomyces sp. NPDC006335 TaxID=3156895 RepID=UPI00339E989D